MSSLPRTPNKVSARYIGHGGYALKAQLGPYYNGNGQRLTKFTLDQGDTVMLPDVEVYGQTLLYDPKGINDPLWLGVGRVVRPDDQGKDAFELGRLGYEFHLGRPDFEPVQPLPASVTPAPVASAASSPESGVSNA